MIRLHDYGDVARWIKHRHVCKNCQCETAMKLDAEKYLVWTETNVALFGDAINLTLETGICERCRRMAYGQDRTCRTHQAGSA